MWDEKTCIQTQRPFHHQIQTEGTPHAVIEEIDWQCQHSHNSLTQILNVDWFDEHGDVWDMYSLIEMSREREMRWMMMRRRGYQRIQKEHHAGYHPVYCVSREDGISRKMLNLSISQVKNTGDDFVPWYTWMSSMIRRIILCTKHTNNSLAYNQAYTRFSSPPPLI